MQRFTDVDPNYVASALNNNTVVDVDGGTALATVTGNASSAVVKTVVTFARGQNHTLNLTASGGAQHVLGVWMFDSTNREIAVFNGSRSGFTAANVVNSNSVENGALPVVAALQPDVTIICLTINDWGKRHNRVGLAVVDADAHYGCESVG